MNKIIFSGVALFGLTICSYAGVPEVIAEKVANIITARINVDKEIVQEALRNASTITIDGELYNHVTIAKRVIMVGNAGVVLLGDINISSVTDITDIKRDAVILGNRGFFVYHSQEETNKTIEKEK